MEEQHSTAQHSAAGPAHGCFFCDIAGPQIEALLGHAWPQDTREHFRTARIEMLKGIRSMLDARIEHLSKHDQKGTKVAVE
jgi:hypothetical protein